MSISVEEMETSFDEWLPGDDFSNCPQNYCDEENGVFWGEVTDEERRFVANLAIKLASDPVVTSAHTETATDEEMDNNSIYEEVAIKESSIVSSVDPINISQALSPFVSSFGSELPVSESPLTATPVGSKRQKMDTKPMATPSEMSTIESQSLVSTPMSMNSLITPKMTTVTRSAAKTTAGKPHKSTPFWPERQSRRKVSKTPSIKPLMSPFSETPIMTADSIIEEVTPKDSSIVSLAEQINTEEVMPPIVSSFGSELPMSESESIATPIVSKEETLAPKSSDSPAEETPMQSQSLESIPMTMNWLMTPNMTTVTRSAVKTTASKPHLLTTFSPKRQSTRKVSKTPSIKPLMSSFSETAIMTADIIEEVTPKDSSIVSLAEQIKTAEVMPPFVSSFGSELPVSDSPFMSSFSEIPIITTNTKNELISNVIDKSIVEEVAPKGSSNVSFAEPLMTEEVMPQFVSPFGSEFPVSDSSLTATLIGSKRQKMGTKLMATPSEMSTIESQSLVSTPMSMNSLITPKMTIVNRSVAKTTAGKPHKSTPFCPERQSRHKVSKTPSIKSLMSSFSETPIMSADSIIEEVAPKGSSNVSLPEQIITEEVMPPFVSSFGSELPVSDSPLTASPIELKRQKMDTKLMATPSEMSIIESKSLVAPPMSMNSSIAPKMTTVFISAAKTTAGKLHQSTPFRPERQSRRKVSKTPSIKPLMSSFSETPIIAADNIVEEVTPKHSSIVSLDEQINTEEVMPSFVSSFGSELPMSESESIATPIVSKEEALAPKSSDSPAEETPTQSQSLESTPMSMNLLMTPNMTTVTRSAVKTTASKPHLLTTFSPKRQSNRRVSKIPIIKPLMSSFSEKPIMTADSIREEVTLKDSSIVSLDEQIKTEKVVPLFVSSLGSELLMSESESIATPIVSKGETLSPKSSDSPAEETPTQSQSLESTPMSMNLLMTPNMTTVTRSAVKTTASKPHLLTTFCPKRQSNRRVSKIPIFKPLMSSFSEKPIMTADAKSELIFNVIDKSIVEEIVPKGSSNVSFAEPLMTEEVKPQFDSSLSYDFLMSDTLSMATSNENQIKNIYGKPFEGKHLLDQTIEPFGTRTLFDKTVEVNAQDLLSPFSFGENPVKSCGQGSAANVPITRSLVPMDTTLIQMSPYRQSTPAVKSKPKPKSNPSPLPTRLMSDRNSSINDSTLDFILNEIKCNTSEDSEEFIKND